MTYQTFTGDPAGPAALLGPQPPRAGGTWPGPRRTPGTARSPGCSGAGCWPASSRRTWTACTRRRARGRSSSCTAAWTGWSASAAASAPPRTELDARLRAANPALRRARRPAINPDGDAVLRRRRRRGVPRRWTAGLRRACSSRTWCSSARTCRRPRVAGVLRAGRAAPAPARARVVADRHVGLPVRPAGRQARHPRRDRQPGRDPRRRLRGRSPSTRRSARPSPPSSGGWTRPADHPRLNERGIWSQLPTSCGVNPGKPPSLCQNAQCIRRGTQA